MEDDPVEDKYHEAREAAKQWLGDRYVLTPIKQRRYRGNDRDDQDPDQRSEV
jgi:hypothetical protein